MNTHRTGAHGLPGISLRAYKLLVATAALGLSACTSDAPEPSAGAAELQAPYLETVQTFADNVLERGRDRYGELHSPLFADGINVDTGEPVRWDGDGWILSNFGSQQNLMRVLTSLSELTGEEKYRQAAVEATQYMFDHHSDNNGLLYWGGHQFVDLETMTHHFEGRPHELKNNFPHYDFLWDVDPEATRRMLRAMWNAHVLDWGKLDLNRHADFNGEMGRLWDHEFEQPEPFYEGRGLTFINFGTDMLQAAMSLYFLDGDEGARLWGNRLFEQYVRARHPDTGLGVYQYSQPEQRDTPPAEGPLEGRLTFSQYGDRAKNQFGAVYGDVALEGNALWGGRMISLYGRNPIMTLHIAEQLAGTEAGETMLDWTLDGMRAYARHAYVAEQNHFRPMWADGTDLSDAVMPRTGYYGQKGDAFPKLEPDGVLALAYARAARLSGGDPEIWHVIRHMMIGQALGDPGVDVQARPQLNPDTGHSDPDMLVAVLELQRATGRDEYFQLADRIADNILDQRWHDGFFKPSGDHINARFDDPEPLALLTLEAVRQGRPEAVPPYLTGIGVTDGEPEGGGRMRDRQFYQETR